MFKNNEQGLLKAIAEGSEKAFHKLYAVYVPLLHPTLFRIVKKNEVAEDIIQEVFIRIWLNRDKLSAIQNPRAWVLRIAYNRAFSYLAKESSYNKILLAASQNQTSGSFDPEETMAFNTIKNLVGRAAQVLPEQQKKVYRLSREEGLPIAEIARTMSLSPQSVKNTLGRALVSIREYIEKSGYPISSLMLFYLSIYF